MGIFMLTLNLSPSSLESIIAGKEWNVTCQSLFPFRMEVKIGISHHSCNVLLQLTQWNWNGCSRSPLNPPLPFKDSPLLLPLMNMLHTTVSSNYAFKTAQQVTIPTLLAIHSRYLHSLCTAYHLMHSVNHEWLMKPDT